MQKQLFHDTQKYVASGYDQKCYPRALIFMEKCNVWEFREHFELAHINQAH